MTTTACDDQFVSNTEKHIAMFSIEEILRRNVEDLELELQRQRDRAEAAESEAEYVREDNHSMMLEIHNLRIELEQAEAALAAAREQEPAVVIYVENGKIEDVHDQRLLKYMRDGIMNLYASPIPAPTAPAAMEGDEFNGDTPHMIRCIEALVDMSDRGKLTPHALCGHARKLLLASANRLRQQVAPSVLEEWREVMAGLIEIAEAKGKKQGSPNHCHSKPGIWDDDNIRNGLAGKPCAECAMYDRARALLQSANHSSDAADMAIQHHPV